LRCVLRNHMQADSGVKTNTTLGVTWC